MNRHGPCAHAQGYMDGRAPPLFLSVMLKSRCAVLQLSKCAGGMYLQSGGRPARKVGFWLEETLRFIPGAVIFLIT